MSDITTFLFLHTNKTMITATFKRIMAINSDKTPAIIPELFGDHNCMIINMHD